MNLHKLFKTANNFTRIFSARYTHLITNSYPVNKMSYKLAHVTQSQIPELAKFSHDNFYMHGCEPMFSMLTQPGQAGMSLETCNFRVGVSLQTSTPETFLTLRDSKTGQLVAMMISTIETATTEKYDLCTITPKNIDPEDQKRKDIVFGLLEKINANAVIQKLATTENCSIYFIHQVSCDTQLRGLGLGRQITQHGIEMARKLGCKYVVTEATGKYSQNIYENLGFETLDEIKYETQPEFQGHELLKIHSGCKLMILKL